MMNATAPSSDPSLTKVLFSGYNEKTLSIKVELHSYCPKMLKISIGLKILKLLIFLTAILAFIEGASVAGAILLFVYLGALVLDVLINKSIHTQTYKYYKHHNDDNNNVIATTHQNIIHIMIVKYRSLGYDKYKFVSPYLIPIFGDILAIINDLKLALCMKKLEDDTREIIRKNKTGNEDANAGL